MFLFSLVSLLITLCLERNSGHKLGLTNGLELVDSEAKESADKAQIIGIWS